MLVMVLTDGWREWSQHITVLCLFFFSFCIAYLCKVQQHTRELRDAELNNDHETTALVLGDGGSRLKHWLLRRTLRVGNQSCTQSRTQVKRGHGRRFFFISFFLGLITPVDTSAWVDVPSPPFPRVCVQGFKEKQTAVTLATVPTRWHGVVLTPGGGG